MNIVIAQNVSLDNHLALSTYLKSIAKYLARHKEIDLYLIVQAPPGLVEELPANQICTIESDTYTLKGNFKYSWRLYRALRDLNAKTRIDLIHCLYPNSSLLGAAAFKKLCSPQVKIVYDIRSPWIEASIERLSLGLETTLYRKIAYASEAFLGRFVDRYIFITKGLKGIYEGTLKERLEPSTLIPSGVDLDVFFRQDPSPVREQYGIYQEDIIIGYVGVLSRERELDFSIQALSELRSRDKRYKLMFVGEGDDKQRLQDVSSTLGLKEKVIFTGKVDYEHVPRYISAFDFGLCHLPDTLFFRHSFPMKVLEYTACGTPVVASSIHAHQEIAEDIPIILYESKSPTDLAQKILEQDNKRDGIEDNIHLFAWNNIAGDLVEYYRDLIQHPS